MSPPCLPRLLSFSFALSVSAGLAACGGAGNATVPPALAANVAHMPVADCEPQACQGMRIVDSNAETFRADSARRDALAVAVARLDDR